MGNRINHLKEWWWAYLVGSIVMTGLIKWLFSLDYSYGADACIIPVVASWVVVGATIIPGIIMICKMDDTQNK